MVEVAISGGGEEDIAGDSTRPRAIPLAMSTMKKETLGSRNFYA